MSNPESDITSLMRGELPSRYVQHISGQGEKWKVEFENPGAWGVSSQPAGACIFPKSEYVLVAPPERWVNVTENCSISPDIPSGLLVLTDLTTVNRVAKIEPNYRLCKVRTYVADSRVAAQSVFLIERREP
jgi:hypothetical protein